ncbi:MAG: hypothetical protein PHS48_06240 [Bacteroidales bacterium]|nr:hypothetical protein [Bacteroidales bacterium]
MKEEYSFQKFIAELESLRQFVLRLEADQPQPSVVKGVLLHRVEKLYEQLLLAEETVVSSEKTAAPEIKPEPKSTSDPVAEIQPKPFKTPQPEPEPKAEVKPQAGRLYAETSLNSLLAPPLSDISSAIGLNDRFLFTRELFGSNPKLFFETIQEINRAGSLDSALNYLQEKFSWDPESEAVAAFLLLVRRRYS